MLRTPHYTITKYYPERIIKILFTELTKNIRYINTIKSSFLISRKWETLSFLSVRQGEKWKKKKGEGLQHWKSSKMSQKFPWWEIECLTWWDIYESDYPEVPWPHWKGHDEASVHQAGVIQIWYSLETQEWRDPGAWDGFLKLQ